MTGAAIRSLFRHALGLGILSLFIGIVALSLVWPPAVTSDFWRTLWHQSRLEAEARKGVPAGTPAFAILEDRDESWGLAITSTFVSIIYDESDEIGLPQGERSAGWHSRTRDQIGGVYGVERLHGHFYRVTKAYP